MKFIIGNGKTRDEWNGNIVDTKTALISELQIHILMEPTILGSIMTQFPIVTQHHNLIRKINRKDSDIQIGVVQNLNRFDRIKKKIEST